MTKANSAPDARVLNYPGPHEADWVPVIAERDSIYFRPQPFFRGTEDVEAEQERLLAFWEDPSDPANAALLDSADAAFARELARLIARSLQAASDCHTEEDELSATMRALGIVGRSEAMLSLFRQVVQVSRLADLPVLITGETGTGKELVARAIQRRERRSRFAVDMLLVHLSRHENTAGEHTENAVPHLTGEMNWTPDFAQAAVSRAGQQGLIEQQGDHLRLTDDGRGLARQVQAR